MENQSTVLIYGTNMGGYRTAYALCKAGHKVILLNQGRYVDEKKNQLLSQLPLDFCWICGHMPQRLFKALGCLQDYYNADILSISGEAGNFRVKFKKRDQLVNNFACTECDKCIEVCPVEVGDRKAIWVHPEVAWENIYLIDSEHCTKCGKCEEICPTGALKLERPEEIIEEDVGAIILAPEFDEPDEEDLKDFSWGKSSHVIKNSEIAGRSLLTNFVKDSVRLPSGEIPKSFGIVITPHFNKSGAEYENYNLSVSAMYRAAKIKEIMPESKVTVFLRDYKGFGKGHYRWYEKALDNGVKVVRTENVKVKSDGEKAVIEFNEDEQIRNKEVELAILVTGQKPPNLMHKFSQLCGIKADENGFCHIRPFSCSETDVDGIYAVGEFSGAKGNPETVWEGCATLSEVLKYLGPKNFKPAAPPALRDISKEKVRLGVFICSCFGKFNEKIDLKALEERVGNLSGVAHVETIPACCTPPTITETAEKIKKSGVNRVVLAVCTPLQKLLKYRKAVMMAGLNPLLSQFLRFREDVIYVHTDKEKMLKKALALIRSGVESARVGKAAPPLTDTIIPDVIVIGAGISGLMYAFEMAEKGFPVSLIEQKEKLGGNLAYLETEEKNYINKLIEKVETHPNITIFMGSNLKNVEGYAGNFHAIVNSKEGDKLIKAGVIAIATGAKEFKPKDFLYGEDDSVMTQAELMARMDGKKLAEHVAMIQCVGSRDKDYPYCSRVCCNNALKNALSLRRNGSEVTIFYRDITTYGKEDYYQKAINAGVKFVRFNPESYPAIKRKGDKLEIIASNGNKEYSETVELVALSTAIIPDNENNKQLSALLGHPLDKDGFFDSDITAYPFEEATKKLTKPFELASNAIFPIGLAHSPRNFQECILTARDAVGRTLTFLGKKRIPSPNAMYVAEVKESLCMGCGVCVDICPYSARYIDSIKKVAVVRPFLCDSCGSCVAICPNNASLLRDFKGAQAISALDVLLG
jgi:heterodisulfide reductase subunit A